MFLELKIIQDVSLSKCLSQNPRQSQNAVRDGTSCIKWRGTLASWGLDMRETKATGQNWEQKRKTCNSNT